MFGSFLSLTVGAFCLQLELFSFYTYRWSLSACSGKEHLISTSMDCKQRSSSVSNKAPTVSKNSSRVPPFEIQLPLSGSHRSTHIASDLASRELAIAGMAYRSILKNLLIFRIAGQHRRIFAGAFEASRYEEAEGEEEKLRKQKADKRKKKKRGNMKNPQLFGGFFLTNFLR